MRFSHFVSSVICAASMANAQVSSVSDPSAFHSYSNPTTSRAPVATAANASAVSQLPDDLQLLVGKHVVVGRLPLCTPNTYAVSLDYAGKKAIVRSFKANQSLSRLGANMGRLPINVRAMMEDAKKGGVVELQFADGKILDTCGELVLSQLSSGLSLAPGETVPRAIAAVTAPAQAQAPALAQAATEPAAPPVAEAQACPVAIINASSGVSFGHLLVDALTTSEFQRQIDEATHGGQSKHYLDLKVSNASGKAISAFEFVSLYEDRMGDETTSATYVSQNTHPIRPGETFRTSAMDREELSQNGAGKVVLFISRVRFDDESMWQDNGSHSCARATVAK